MAKEEGEAKVVAKSDRELRWAEFLKAYEKQNPSKYAIRKAAKELDKIPDSFV
jgi:hypothetical protein